MNSFCGVFLVSPKITKTKKRRHSHVKNDINDFKNLKKTHKNALHRKFINEHCHNELPLNNYCHVKIVVFRSFNHSIEQ